MNLSLFLTYLSLVGISIGCGYEDHSSKARHKSNSPSAPKGDLIPSELRPELTAFEEILVTLADNSLKDHTFAQERHWKTGGVLKVKNIITASARASIRSFDIKTIAKVGKEEYLLAFRSDLIVSHLRASYRAKDEFKASMSNVELPTTLNAALYVHIAESKKDELHFVPGKNGKFVDYIDIHVNSFHYEDTFLENLPKYERSHVRNQLRSLINEILQKKEDSIAAKLDADLNKLTAKEKINLSTFLQDADQRLSN